MAIKKAETPSANKKVAKKDTKDKNVASLSAVPKTQTATTKSATGKTKPVKKKQETHTGAVKSSPKTSAAKVTKKPSSGTARKTKTVVKASQASSSSKGANVNDMVENASQKTSKTATTGQPKTATKTAAKKKNSPKKLPTTIVAKVDVGYGNSVYVRGEGGGLNWESGILMENTGDDEWSWQTKPYSGVLSFKFLINDKNWCLGENLVAVPGETSIWTPTF